MQPQPTNRRPTSSRSLLVLLCSVLLCASLAEATSPSLLSQLGLVKPELTAASVLEHHQSTDVISPERSFAGPTLAYVTPWNSRGYEMAERYANKLDYISPVWYQFKHRGDGRVELEGGHDHDGAWIARVHQRSTHTRIVPRFLFDGWQEDDFRALIRRRSRSQQLASLLREHCLEHAYDGIVLDAGYLVHLRRNERLFIDFFSRLSAELRDDAKLSVILVLPPPSAHPQAPYTVEIYRKLEPLFDHLQVMSYDFSAQSPGPNSPLQWLPQIVNYLIPAPERTEERLHKLILGTNFYGYRWLAKGGGREAVLGTQLVELLERELVEIAYDEQHAEHSFRLSRSGDVIYFPSLWSVHARVDMARALRCGIGIWELGQGLEYFMDVL
mmetsp:Transcript_7600/g.23398  ORF Transcript_7600/g.23398 Transcript_7600/m.23398 type:complete len:385 (+) Transcript_7600:99-1253(+)|eukprot:CAMPEP_0177681664 /NCGR_PEP_ID=MMETSP0447-20121125/30846_1 /TAXON_ID=0 /ORGANISM="Stygamoeba regulata, Strain BSH-02190019" /LENGTH=384 /DNA_ID=CAMNT_0019191115 /DNA_START=95 /DNA_END=1249 /DNA_ORIENTATION=-